MKTRSFVLLILMILAGLTIVQGQDCESAVARTNQLAAEVKDLEERIARHQKAIRSINPDMRADQIGEFEKLSEEAKTAAISAFIDAFLSSSTIFTSTEKRAHGLITKKLGSLTPYKINKIAKQWTSPLREVGYNTSALESSLRSLLRDKTMIPEFLDTAVDKISHAKTAYEVGGDVKEALKEPDEEKKRKILLAYGDVFNEIFGTLVAVTPARAIVLANAQLIISTTYSGYSLYFKHLAQQLVKLTEPDLLSLSNIFRLMKQDVAVLKLTKNTLENAKRYASTDQCKPLNALQIVQQHSPGKESHAESKANLKRLLQEAGIRVVDPSQAVSSGKLKIIGKSRSGFSSTDVQFVNEFDEIIAIDVNELYLIPANESSPSQRIGLVSVVERQTQNLNQHCEICATTREFTGLESYGGPNFVHGPTIEENEWLDKEMENVYVQVPPQTNNEPKGWVYKNWVILAPKANVLISFNSVCLDSGRGTPKNGEGFYLSDRSLPERVQEILNKAAINGTVPQGEVWNTIKAERITWYDPRTIPEMLQRARTELSSRQFATAIQTCNEIINLDSSAKEAVKLLGESYYWLGLSTQQPNQAPQFFAESYNHLSKAISLGEEVVLPVTHHHGGFTDQNLCQGFITLGRDQIHFRSNDQREGEFRVPYGGLKVVKLELNKVSRLHLRVGSHSGNRETVFNYNFHSALVGVQQNAIPLSLTSSIQFNSLSCSGECQPSVKLIHDLILQFRYYKGNPNDSLLSIQKGEGEMRFFESNNEVPPVEQRKFESQFSTNSRYINWHIGLAFPASQHRTPFSIKTIWYGSDGNVMWEVTSESYLDKDWTSSSYAAGIGNLDGKYWKPGKYKVELYIGEKLIATGSFGVSKSK